jgi:hypothetical protein
MAARKKDSSFPWVRQSYESEPSYQAFRTYLNFGHARTLRKVCEETAKSWTLISKWSAENEWSARCRAYDIHVSNAETDGVISALAVSKDKNLELVDKLRGHLSNRLDSFIMKDQDPTIRWTQALTAMARLEANCFTIKDDAKTAEKLEKVEQLIDRVMAERD